MMRNIHGRHLEKMLHEYVSKYYNPHRTHQGLGSNTYSTSRVSANKDGRYYANGNTCAEWALSHLEKASYLG